MDAWKTPLMESNQNSEDGIQNVWKVFAGLIPTPDKLPKDKSSSSEKSEQSY
jgi:hypothetical protein